MYIFDTREQKNDHIKKWFDKHGIAYRTEKLDCGDYMIDGGSLTIDRKQNLDELAKNLLNPQDKQRFIRECKRAMETGVKIIVLCEHGKGVKSLPDIRGWKSKYSPVTGKALLDAIYRVCVSYGVQFVFCDRRQTARKIIEILKSA